MKIHVIQEMGLVVVMEALAITIVALVWTVPHPKGKGFFILIFVSNLVVYIMHVKYTY